MLKPPRRARASALPPGAEYHRPRPKPLRRARPAPPPDLQLTAEQLELLRAIGAERTGVQPVPDERWGIASALAEVGLVELELPPPSPYASRPAWRPALVEDRRPWRAKLTEHGRRLLERTGGST
jgi:hypothetical protein